MTPDQLLDRGADIIETRGHTKRALRDDHGFCFYGSMYEALNEVVDYEVWEVLEDENGAWHGICREHVDMIFRAGAAVIDEIRKPELAHLHHLSYNWNDLDETTATHVIDTMRHAAKRYRGGA